jgi:hypothetical protein
MPLLPKNRPAKKFIRVGLLTTAMFPPKYFHSGFPK